MPITFNCPGCAKGYSVPETVAGRSTRCKACNTTFTIPMSSPAAAPAPAAGFGGDPPRKRGGFPFKMVGLVAAAFIVVGLVGGGIGYALLATGSPAAMNFMPDNCQVLVSVRAADFAKSGVWAIVTKEYPDAAKKITETMKDAPFQLEDVTQVLVGVGDTTAKEAVVAIEFKKAVKLDDIIAFMNKQSGQNKELKESKVGKYTIKGDDEGAVCQVNTTLIVGGTPAALKAVLERDKKPTFSVGMQRALADADLTQTFAMAMNFKDLAKNPMVGGSAKAGGVNVESMETGAVNINVAADIKINSVSVCKDAQTAEENKTMAMGGIIAVKRMAGDQLPKEILEILNGIKIEQKDNRLTANVQFKIEPILDLVKKFGGMNFGVSSKQTFTTVGQQIGGPDQKFGTVGGQIGGNGKE